MTQKKRVIILKIMRKEFSEQANATLWQRVERSDKCQRRLFKPSACRQVMQVLEDQGMDTDQVFLMAYFTSTLFRSADRVFQYAKKWGADIPNSQMSDILSDISLPLLKDSPEQGAMDLMAFPFVPEDAEVNLKSWGDAVLQNGPRMAGLLPFINYMPEPMKTPDGKRFSYKETRYAIAQVVLSPDFEDRDLAERFRTLPRRGQGNLRPSVGRGMKPSSL